MLVRVLIPARWGSSRFEGKPLAMLGGHTVIERVYRRAMAAKVGPVAVATDDSRIFDAVRSFGGEAVMTRIDHRSGTDRVCEAAEALGDADVVINVQGDEPFINPDDISNLAACFADDTVDIASLTRRFDPADGFDALFDPNLVKVVMDERMNALYFSRSIIPYVRAVDWKRWLDTAVFHTHVGVYAYRGDVLRKISKLPQSALEKAESLEQLRWLAAGYNIRMKLTSSITVGIDTPADLAAAEQYLDEHPDLGVF